MNKNYLSWPGILLVLFVLGVIVSVFASPEKAYAATAEWLDRARIKVGDKMLVDKGPFDDNWEYTVTGNCPKINGFDNKNLNKATLHEKDSFGKCEKNTSITIGSVGNAAIIGYRVDQENIIGISPNISLENPLALYRRPPPDERTDQSTYFLVNGSSLDRQYFIGTSPSVAICVKLDVKNAPDPIECKSGTLASNGNPVTSIAGIEDIKAFVEAQSSGNGKKPISCDSKGGRLGWLVCSGLELMDGIVRQLDSLLKGLLETPNSYLNDDSLIKAWSTIRSFAYIILVPITLVMVISTALGFEFISAYTIKRALPRLVFATIFIALSYDVSKYLVQLTNDVGVGIDGLIRYAFSGGERITLISIFHPTDGNVVAGGSALFLAGTVALSIGSIGIVFSFLGIMLLGLLIGFVLLSLRQFLIIALMIMAPLAIVAWIFPGTGRLWKLWWDTFSKLLMLFPLIMLLIAVGQSFAMMVAKIGGEGDIPLGNTLIKVVAYAGPYFMIPSMFKFGGTMFGAMAGVALGSTQGLKKRAKDYRGRKMGETWAKTRAGQRFSGTNALSGFANRNLQRMSYANKIGFGGLVNPRKAKGRIDTAASGASIAAAQAGLEKDPSFAQIKNDDDLLTAGINGGSESDVRRFLEQRGRHTGRVFNEQDVQAVMSARRALGNNFNDAAIVAKTGTGTGYAGENGSGELVADIIAAAGGDRNREAAMFAAAKSAANGARRYDLGGIGFGSFFEQREAIRNANPADRQASIATASKAMIDNSLDTQGAGAVLAGRAQSVQTFAPALRRRIQRAQNNLQAAYDGGDAAEIEMAQVRYTQDIASTEALVDVAGQASPEAARALSDHLHSAEIRLDAMPDEMRDWLATQPDGTRTITPAITVRQVMDNLGARGGVYDEMRRNYSSSYQRELAQRQTGAAEPLTAPPPGPGTGII